MGLALPPLVAGECSVYSVRRLHCRAHNFCLVAAWGTRSRVIRTGTLRSMRSISRPPRAFRPDCCRLWPETDVHRQLATALRLILEEPDAIDRWCAGKNVFAAAILAPDDPEQAFCRELTLIS